jgi:hypothetical protein
MEINWSNPPSKKHSQHSEFVDALKANPGSWALWRTDTYASNAFVLRKTYEGLEVRTVSKGKNEKGTSLFDIYVRYVPVAVEAESF